MATPGAEHSAVLPPAALAACLVCLVGAGVVANSAVMIALFRRERNAFHSIVAQLAAADLVSLCVPAALEAWSRNEGAWRLGDAACALHLGCDVFSSVAAAYFAATLALHALATARRERTDARATRRRRRADDDSDGEMRSSQHSLVAGSDSSTPPRTMNIDYRIADSSVPVSVPIVFVWGLAASLTVPALALATTARVSGVPACTFLDPTRRISLHAVRSAFDLLLPAFILSTAAAVTLTARRRKTRRRAESSETAAALRLSTWLAGVFLAMSAPRGALEAYHALASGGDFRSYLVSPAPRSLALSVSLLGSSASLVRPVLAALTLPGLRSSLTSCGRARVI